MATQEHRRAASIRGVRHQVLSCFPGRDAGFLCRGERPEAVLPAAFPDVGIPCIPLMVPTTSNNAPVLRFASKWRDILAVGVLWENPQIHTPVVKTVAIDVVAIATIMTPRQAEQFSVQEYGSFLAVVPDSATRRIAVATERPSPLPDPFDIGGVDYGVRADCFSILAMQWDQRGQAVFADLNHWQGDASTPLVGTAVRAAWPYHRRGSKERRSADQTDTLNRHRRVPSGGVAPRTGANSAGAFARLDFTIPGIVVY